MHIPPTDQLILRAICFTCPCGVFPEERRHGMNYRADITLHLDLMPAGSSDKLAQTVDYAQVTDTVLAVAKKERFLVEALAEDVANAVLRDYPITAITVKMTKQNPPVDAIFEGVTVVIHRPRPAE